MTRDKWISQNPIRKWIARREREKNKKVTLAHVAGHLGCSLPALRGWLQGTSTPRPRSVEPLAKMMDISQTDWSSTYLSLCGQPAPSRSLAA